LGSHLVLEVYKLHHRQSRGNKGWVQIMMGMINRVNGDMGNEDGQLKHRPMAGDEHKIGGH